MSLAEQYQQKTDLEHILDAPDTYVGSTQNTTSPLYLWKDGKIVLEDGEFNPALLKMFDETVVNARDHDIRTQKLKETIPTTQLVTSIHVEIKNDIIKMTNNGDGIHVERHPVNNLWIPEMIFGHLRTSTNYNKEEQKITGGKNGLGFKLVLIWSTWGEIETVDANLGLKYHQVFENKMNYF